MAKRVDRDIKRFMDQLETDTIDLLQQIRPKGYHVVVESDFRSAQPSFHVRLKTNKSEKPDEIHKLKY